MLCVNCRFPGPRRCRHPGRPGRKDSCNRVSIRPHYPPRHGHQNHLPDKNQRVRKRSAVASASWYSRCSWSCSNLAASTGERLRAALICLCQRRPAPELLVLDTTDPEIVKWLEGKGIEIVTGQNLQAFDGETITLSCVYTERTSSRPCGRGRNGDANRRSRCAAPARCAGERSGRRRPPPEL